ncbi:UNVERIFIED_CONTAM: hypothetical protein NCL1_25152 [Trichonephila clavipes]
MGFGIQSFVFHNWSCCWWISIGSSDYMLCSQISLIKKKE